MQTETPIDAGFDVVAPRRVRKRRSVSPGKASLFVVMDIRLAGERDGIDAAASCSMNSISAVFSRPPMTTPRPASGAKPFAPLGWLPKPYTARSLVTLVTEAVSALD